MTRKGSRSAALTVAGALAVAAVLAIALNGKRDEFAEALQSAPLWVLAVVAALQVLALVTRCEAWRTCVEAAGATISRRRLFRAGGLGNLGSLVNAQLGAAARIAVLRRSAPDETPKIPALIAAEIPIIMIEGMLAALSSYTLVGPLGLPWWTPLIASAVLLGAVIVLSRLAGRGHERRRGGRGGHPRRQRRGPDGSRRRAPHSHRNHRRAVLRGVGRARPDQPLPRRRKCACTTRPHVRARTQLSLMFLGSSKRLDHTQCQRPQLLPFSTLRVSQHAAPRREAPWQQEP
jgi:hypothetical protein